MAALAPGGTPDLERTITSTSPEQTRALGVRLGELLQPGDFVGLIGDLGAGKTHFVRGVAEGVGVERSQVASPTFAIVYPYEGGRIRLYHADLYRLADYDELYATGFMDLLGGDGAVLVEWLDNVPEAAPAERLVIEIDVPTGEAAENERAIKVRAFGARAAARLQAWLAEDPS
jgi:tRNA threonylcarbamoyladenosine biosynthesis protein TsaE